MKASWLAIPLLLCASCSSSQGAWGTNHATATWDSGLSKGSGRRLPGMTSGSISRIGLEMGDKGTFHLAIWSDVDHDCSSGGGFSTGAYIEGKVLGPGGARYPIALTCKDGETLTGTIGEQEVTLKGSALLLLHGDAEELVIKEVNVPAHSIEALDLSREVTREVFAERFKVAQFFESHQNR